MVHSISQINPQIPGALSEVLGAKVEDVLSGRRIVTERVARVRCRGRVRLIGFTRIYRAHLRDVELGMKVGDARIRSRQFELHGNGAALLEDRTAVAVDRLQYSRPGVGSMLDHGKGREAGGVAKDLMVNRIYAVHCSVFIVELTGEGKM